MRTAAIAFFCLSAAAIADDAARGLVPRILATADPAERGKLVDALVAARPDPRAAASWFGEGLPYAAREDTGWFDGTVLGSDGKTRPYLLYVPETYTPEKKYPLLVDMHGGVSLPAPLTHRELDQMKFFWGEQAEAEGCFLAIPAGEAGAEWWTAVGAGNVLSILAETRRTYNIDENRTFATGFSDGGSGSYYLALAAPTVLAGVIPLNGHIGVAQAGGLEVHLRNFVNVPIYAVNTVEDRLYPSASMKPLIDAMRELGAPVTWREIAGYGHDPSYLPEERPAIWAWILATQRNPHPSSVTWEGAAPSRVRWLNVTELCKRGDGASFPDVNPKLPPGAPRIGVVIDPAFEGPGVRVKQVQEGTPAAAIGIMPDDVLVALDGAAIGDMADLQRGLRVKKPGDGFKVSLRRGEETVEKEGTFPEAKPEAALRRGPSYGSIRADVKDNVVEVRANGIRSFEIFLSDPLFDLEKPVVVRVNGETVHTGVVAPDLRFLAEQAAADQDRSMIYLARLRVTVPSRGS